MKILIFLFILSFNVGAKPIEMMNQKLAVYKQSNLSQCLPGETGSLDDGLFIDISCSFTCAGGGLKVERVKGSFIPKEHGLYPGNGSSGSNTIWSSVGIMLKMWSQEVCLSRAAESCLGIKLVTASEVSELESGKWKLEKFPGCRDQTITLSPFDESSGSSRMNYTSGKLLSNFSTDNGPIVEKPSQYQLKLHGLSVEVPFSHFNSKLPCQNKIKADLCFGDCIDLKSEKNQETLGTSEPLGREVIELCGDDLVAKFKNHHLSTNIKKQICEDYFWNSLNSGGQSIISACAAIRGEVICEGL